jgi:hypothetical protein
MVEAALALPAKVYDPPVVRSRHFADLALVVVDPLEHVIEGGTQAMAAPTTVADLGDASEFALHPAGVEEGGVGGIECH